MCHKVYVWFFGISNRVPSFGITSSSYGDSSSVSFYAYASPSYAFFSFFRLAWYLSFIFNVLSSPLPYPQNS